MEIRIADPGTIDPDADLILDQKNGFEFHLWQKKPYPDSTLDKKNGSEFDILKSTLIFFLTLSCMGDFSDP